MGRMPISSPHDRGGGRDAAALLHLLEAVGSEDDLHLVHLGLKLADDVAELRAVLQFAGHLAQIPAEHHRVGVGVEQMDIQVVFRALLPQHPLGHDGVVVGGRAGAVDGDMDDIGVASSTYWQYFSQNWMGVMAAVEGMPLAARILS